MKSLILLAALGTLAACNTFEGLGRDLAAGGDAITNAAEEAQNPPPQPTVYQQARPAAQPPAAYQQPAYQRPVYQQSAAPAYNTAIPQPAAPVYAPAPIQSQPLPTLPAPQGQQIPSQQPTGGPYGF